MTLLAAAATTRHGISGLFITGLVLLLLACWLASLFIWPYTRCRWCGSTGKRWGSTSKRHGDCLFCHGQGRRRRRFAGLVHRGSTWRRKP